MANSDEYLDACKAHVVACRVYLEMADKYQAQEIGGMEFLAAREAKTVADASWEAAFNKEADRPEVTDEQARVAL